MSLSPSTPVRPPRQSNIELLRIVAMFFVLILHADYFSLGIPTALDLQATPATFWARHGFEALAIGSVNVFVLISGYFGIRPKARSFLNLLFQSLFMAITIHLLCVAFGSQEMTGVTLQACVFLRPVNWFLLAYVGLYILSPVLNAFVDQGNRRLHRNVLIGFFVLETIWGATGAREMYANGYSTLSFIGLYLLARYLRLYQPRPCRWSAWIHLLVFLLITLLLTLLQGLATGCGLSVPILCEMNYINPLVIVQACALLLCFSKLSFTWQPVNWLAASAFSVYLVHINPNILRPYFKKAVQTIYDGYDGFHFLYLMGCFLVGVFLLCVVYDQLRLLLWRALVWLHDRRRK